MLRLQLIFLLFGAALGAFYPFVSVILASRGFRPAEIGLVTAVAPVAFSLGAMVAWWVLPGPASGATPESPPRGETS